MSQSTVLSSNTGQYEESNCIWPIPCSAKSCWTLSSEIALGKSGGAIWGRCVCICSPDSFRSSSSSRGFDKLREGIGEVSRDVAEVESGSAGDVVQVRENCRWSRCHCLTIRSRNPIMTNLACSGLIVPFNCEIKSPSWSIKREASEKSAISRSVSVSKDSNTAFEMLTYMDSEYLSPQCPETSIDRRVSTSWSRLPPLWSACLQWIFEAICTPP